MRGVLRRKEPALLAVFVWFGWTLFTLTVLMILADLALVYGDDVWAWGHDPDAGRPSPVLEVSPAPSPKALSPIAR